MRKQREKFHARGTLLVCGVLLSALVTGGVTLFANPRHSQAPAQPQAQSAPAQAQQEPPPSEWKEQLASPDETKAAGEYYKNLQIFGGMPAPRLVVVMKKFTQTLGVRCSYCHVVGEWSRDDLEPKKTARAMVKMVGAISQQFFPGKMGPTCWTCHRGSPKPEFDVPAPPPQQPPPTGN